MNSLRLNVCDAQKHATMYLFHDDAVSIGRSPDNHLVLDHPSVSRHHVRLDRRDHGWIVTDLHSTNGTRIGDESIKPNQPCDWSLLKGIQVGEFTLIPQSVTEVDEPTQVLMGTDEIEASRSAMMEAIGLDSDVEVSKAGPPPVERTENFSVTLLNNRPLQSNKRCYLRVHNLGSDLDCFELMQPEGGLEFTGQEAIFLQANEWNNIIFYVQQPNRPILGIPRRTPLKLNVINQNGMLKSAQTDLFIRPLFPVWILVLSALSLAAFYILRTLAIL